jgi:hypothetical protein
MRPLIPDPSPSGTLPIVPAHSEEQRPVAINRLSVGLHMGGLGVQHPDEILQGFLQNLPPKICKHTGTANTIILPIILVNLLCRVKRPSLGGHVQRLRLAEQGSTADRDVFPGTGFLVLCHPPSEGSMSLSKTAGTMGTSV